MSWAGLIERDPALFAHYSRLDFLINEAAAGRILRKEAGLLLVAFGLVSVLFGQTVALAGQTRDPMPCFQPGGPGQDTARASAGMPGVEIHELKAHVKQWQDYRAEVSSGEYLSMHARLMLFDEEMVMVGSPNLDPRSKYINTEIGLLIRSKALADILMEQFRQDLSPRNSYRVQIDAAGSLHWESASGRRHRQPARSLTQRARVLFYSLLPLDHQL
jgi:hypothetical protein